jgi:serine/threonine protein kinase
MICSLQLASALEYLHQERNIIFRDLKPHNIGFAAEDQVQLFGF